MCLVTDRAGDLIESTTLLSLNEPNKLGDVSWFEPTKYGGIWWDMHIGTKTWDKASGRHGATTAYAKEHIDFLSENGIGALLVEGWNTGWEGWFGDARPEPDGPFDFVTPYDDYDIAEVIRYRQAEGRGSDPASRDFRHARDLRALDGFGFRLHAGP